MLKFLLAQNGYEVQVNGSVFGHLSKGHGFCIDHRTVKGFISVSPDDLRAIALAAEFVIAGLPVHPDGPYAGIEPIYEHDLPREFQAANMYHEMGANKASHIVDRFKKWRDENKVYYYARPKHQFREEEGYLLAAQAGCTKVILEDMS